MLKNRNIIIVLVIFTMAIGILSSSYATGKDRKISELKAQILLDDAWADIKKSFGLQAKLKNYKALEFEQFNDFMQGKIEGFDNKELCSELIAEFIEVNKEIPIGTTIPKIFVKNKPLEMIIAYKDENGVNTLEILQDNNGKWDHEKMSAKGKPLLNYNSIKIE